jgi:hypothetical protein
MKNYRLPIPQNDEQLNQLSQQLNHSYTHSFDFPISEKRSNKLRDCTCRLLGFHNGGYQQLQAYWRAEHQYDFSNPFISSGLSSSLLFDGAKQGDIAAVLASGFLAAWLPILREYFPVLDGEFCDVDRLQAGFARLSNQLFGWQIHHERLSKQSFVGRTDPKHYNAPPSKSTLDLPVHLPRFQKDRGAWYPLYYGTLIVGMAFKQTTAELLNGILTTCHQHDGKKFRLWGYIDHNVEDAPHVIAWRRYVQTHLALTEQERQAPDNAFFVLKQSGMPLGISMPFDAITLSDLSATWSFGGTPITLSYARQNEQDKDTPIWSRLRFDRHEAFSSTSGSLYLDDDTPIKHTQGEALYTRTLTTAPKAVEATAYAAVDWCMTDGINTTQK